MTLSEAHKKALAQGREEARAIRAYLDALDARGPGRPVTRESLESRIEAIAKKLKEERNPLKKVELMQKELDLRSEIGELAKVADFDALVAGFIANAKSYSERKDISYTAWRQIGVPAAVLKEAGVPETRRR